MSRRYTSSPPKRLHGVQWVSFSLLSSTIFKYLICHKILRRCPLRHTMRGRRKYKVKVEILDNLWGKGPEVQFMQGGPRKLGSLPCNWERGSGHRESKGANGSRGGPHSGLYFSSISVASWPRFEPRNPSNTKQKCHYNPVVLIKYRN